MQNNEEAKVFISYASEDIEVVRKLYNDLKSRDIDVWFDKENLKPGRWKDQITKAITQCRYFIICISEATLRKIGNNSPGFQDEELQLAFNIAMNQPVASFAIIPVRIENCKKGGRP